MNNYTEFRNELRKRMINELKDAEFDYIVNQWSAVARDPLSYEYFLDMIAKDCDIKKDKIFDF